jgi:hypothetical protein
LESNFKIDPIWKHKDVLGLDLGTRFLKVVQLEKKGKLTKLVGYGKTKVPENYIIEGIVSEPEKLAETVKDLISNKVWGKITAKRVNLSLPESKIYTRLLTLPHMKEKDLAERVIRGEDYFPATHALWFYAPPAGASCSAFWFNQRNSGRYKSHCFYLPAQGACPHLY